MKVYCMRHAQASSSVDDTTRPLSPEGEIEVHNLGDFLLAREVKIAHIIHSEKTRARQTADTLARFVSCEHVMPCATGINEEDDSAEMLSVISAWESDTLIVSHLPFIARLVSAMITGNPDKNIIDFPPCTIACLEKTDGNAWILKWVLTPEIVHASTTTGAYKI
jgi:phosphohistidine phosphatase